MPSSSHKFLLPERYNFAGLICHRVVASPCTWQFLRLTDDGNHTVFSTAYLNHVAVANWPLSYADVLVPIDQCIAIPQSSIVRFALWYKNFGEIMILKIIFWLLLTWTMATLVIRVFFYFKERYWYTSWFFEWFLACVACVGVYVVAFHQPILSQQFWWLVLSSVVLSSIFRFRSHRFKEQTTLLTDRQALIVKILMAVYTIPIVIVLFINATNITGVWNT
jgi:hypothetical protein